MARLRRHWNLFALCLALGSVPTFATWSTNVVNSTATTGTITLTDSEGGDVTASFTRYGQGLAQASVTGGSHTNKATNGTLFTFFEVTDVLLWVAPQFTTHLTEAIVGVPTGSCPGSDQTYNWGFFSWDINASHATNDANQPAAGEATWTNATNALKLTEMYNLTVPGGTPSWFPGGGLALDSSTCSGGSFTISGTGDNGGTAFVTPTGGLIIKTLADHLVLAFPQVAIVSKGALTGNYTMVYTRVNNSESATARINPMSGTFNLAGSVFVTEGIDDVTNNSHDSDYQNMSLTVDGAINDPIDGFFKGTFTHEGSSGNALCYVHEDEVTMIFCTLQSPNANGEPANLIMIEQKNTATVSCDSGTPDDTCTFSTTNHAVSDGTVEYYQNLIIDGNSGGGYSGTGAISVEVAGNLTLQNSAVMSSDTFNSISADAISIDSSSSISGNILSLKADDLTIDLGGYITAAELGPQGAEASTNGAGTSGGYYGANGGGGGTHGGRGGDAYTATGAETGGSGDGHPTAYGNKSKPITKGSAGGSGTATRDAGGDGGGRIKLWVYDTITLNGYISADGGDWSGNSTTSGGGGGAAGSIWLKAGTFAGSGTIRADGGDGKDPSSADNNGGGGGGGRISLNQDTLSFNGVISLSGGDGPERAIDGEGGILFISSQDVCTSGDLSTTCTISEATYLGDGDSISGSGNLVIASGGSINVVRPEDDFVLNMTGDVTVQSGGSINADISDLDCKDFVVKTGGSVTSNIAVADLTGHFELEASATFTGNIDDLDSAQITIASGATLSANGKGSAGGHYNENDGAGSGGGYHGEGGAGDAGGGGGSHAASGGDGASASGSGSGSGKGNTTTYGSVSSANTKGSGGGAGYAVSNDDSSGGAGGGLLYLKSTGTVTINGALTVNGENGSGSTSGGGGGSGGSIYVYTTGEMVGTGTLDADGGDGDSAFGKNGGGGSGGYVYIECTTDSHSLTLDASGGSGPGSATNGGNGTTDDSNCYCADPCIGGSPE